MQILSRLGTMGLRQRCHCAAFNSHLQTDIKSLLWLLSEISLAREFFKQYLTEKQIGYLQSCCLREVVALREFTVNCMWISHTVFFIVFFGPMYPGTSPVFSIPSTWSTTQESVESSKGHTIKICSNYGYGHWNMQIPWDFRTSELLGIEL